MKQARAIARNYLEENPLNLDALRYSAPSITPNEIASGIYFDLSDWHFGFPFGETIMPQESQFRRRKINVMGDKSPKANQKKSSQNQIKVNSANQKKNQAVADKQSAGKKK